MLDLCHLRQARSTQASRAVNQSSQGECASICLPQPAWASLEKGGWACMYSVHVGNQQLRRLGRIGRRGAALLDAAASRHQAGYLSIYRRSKWRQKEGVVWGGVVFPV